MFYEVMSKTGKMYHLNVNQISWINVEGPYQTRIAMTDGLEILVGYDPVELLRVLYRLMGQSYEVQS